MAVLRALPVQVSPKTLRPEMQSFITLFLTNGPSVSSVQQSSNRRRQEIEADSISPIGIRITGPPFLNLRNDGMGSISFMYNCKPNCVIDIKEVRNNRVTRATVDVTAHFFVLLNHLDNQRGFQHIYTVARHLIMFSLMSPRALRIRGLRRSFCTTIAAANSQVEKMTSSSKLHQTPLASYEELVRLGDISEDPLQMEAVKKLQQLYDQIMLIDSTISGKSNSEGKENLGYQSSWFTSLFSSSESSSGRQSDHKVSGIKGLYMFGGTGCGKTFIMDLFYEVIPIQRKKRVHFNNFMIDIHKRLHRLKNLSRGSSKTDGINIMEQITNELMEEAYLLCFDEFQVTDIADAMILKSLFESMLAKGAIVVATSNRPPQDLYKNGLQRSLFIPFIKTLSDSTNVHSLMESSRDYRILKSTNQALVSDSLVVSMSLNAPTNIFTPALKV